MSILVCGDMEICGFGKEQEEIFMNMIQTVNDNMLDDEIKISEFSERKDKEEIIESVMGS